MRAVESKYIARLLELVNTIVYVLEQSSIRAGMIAAVASIVPKFFSTVSIKSPGSSVHSFVRSGRLYGNQA